MSPDLKRRDGGFKRTKTSDHKIAGLEHVTASKIASAGHRAFDGPARVDFTLCHPLSVPAKT